MPRKLNPGGRVAICGLTAALSSVVMLFTFVPAGAYALPALAGALMIPVVIDLGAKAAFMTYVAAAVISVILSRNAEAVVLFALFFGYYPILKAAAERRFRRVAEWAVKLAVFNTAAITSYTLLALVFRFDMSEFSIGGVNLPFVFLLLGNAVFVIFDISLTKILTRYMVSLRPHIKRMFRL